MTQEPLCNEVRIYYNSGRESIFNCTDKWAEGIKKFLLEKGLSGILQVEHTHINLHFVENILIRPIPKDPSMPHQVPVVEGAVSPT